MDTAFLAKTALFKNVPPEEIQVRMHCLGGVVRSYEKGSYIHYAGDVVHTVSMVLSGKVIIENDDLWGNRNLLGQDRPGELFAEAYACAENEPC